MADVDRGSADYLLQRDKCRAAADGQFRDLQPALSSEWPGPGDAAAAEAGFEWRRGTLMHQPATSSDIVLGAAQRDFWNRSLRAIDQICIERARQPLPEACRLRRTVDGARRLIDTNDAHRRLSQIDFTAAKSALDRV